LALTRKRRENTERRFAGVKKPYQPPEITFVLRISRDFLTGSGVLIGSDPESGFGPIRFDWP